MQHAVIRSGLCLLPLTLTPVWGLLVAEGYLNFGGGEKDLLLLIPWLIWSFIYLLIFIIAWYKRILLVRAVVYSAAGATVLVSLIWGVMVLWFSGVLGVS